MQSAKAIDAGRSVGWITITEVAPCPPFNVRDRSTEFAAEANRASPPIVADTLAEMEPPQPERCQRPARLTVEYCLGKPKRIRWDCEVMAAPRLRDLLHYILELPTTVESVSLGKLKDVVFANTSKKIGSVQNDVNELQKLLRQVSFPWDISTKCGDMVISHG
jgi:hypothetical protein